jgi:hypothetical protein
MFSKAQTPTTFSANTVGADTLKSSTLIKADAIVANDTIRAKENVIAEHDVKVAGNLDVAGTVNFKTKMVIGATPSAGVTIQYVPGVIGYPSLLKFSAPGGTGIINGNGGTIGSEDSAPNLACLNGQPTPSLVNTFSQMLSIAYNPTNTVITGGQILMGHNGQNAFFETQGSGALNPSTNNPGDLFVNKNCSRNVLFFNHSTPSGAGATNIVSVDGSLNVRQRLQLGYNSANNFVEPNHKLYILNDIGAAGEGLKIKQGSLTGAGIKIATYNNAKAFSISQNSNFTGDGNENFSIEGDGKTTIKTANTTALNIQDATNNIVWQVNNDGKTNIKSSNADAVTIVNPSNQNVLIAKNDGRLLIGNPPSNTTAFLSIKTNGTNDGFEVIGSTGNRDFLVTNAGYVFAREIRVKAGSIPDYVFESNYKLRSLNEVETYYKTYKHLPEVPCEAEIVKENLNLGEMTTILLKKIEELTIYVVEQQKEINKLKENKLKNK